ncbi:hypothetical protein ACFY36_41120 [Actinoplanes sp. NPDC000266]
MSQPPAGAGVHTEGGRHGAVAGTIHGGVHNYYEYPPPDASLAEKLASALTFLASGQATTARRLLNEVIAEDPDSSKVCLYWLLAFFSGRTYGELSAEERHQVTTELKRIGELPSTRWSAGIAVVQRLVHTGRPRPGKPVEATGLEADLDALAPDINTAIRSHLARLIQGSLKDEVWHRDVREAQAGQNAGNRRQRAWKFFEPDPRAPRVGPVPSAVVTPVALVLAGLAVVSVIGASATLGRLVLQRDDVTAAAILVGILATATVSTWFGVEIRFRDDTVRAHEREVRAIRSSRDALRPGGFVASVDRLYLRYIRKFAPPEDGERSAWLTDSYVPLRRLRNDLVEAYREPSATADEIKWLIRFQVKELRQRWSRGEPLDPRPTVPPLMRPATALGAVLSLLGLMWVLPSALRQDVIPAAGAFLALAFAAVVVATLGIRIMAERRRVVAGEIERRRRQALYGKEYERWRQRLADRPDDIEMARWLDCDRRLLLDHAIQAYRLKWSDIQAYASLEAEGPNSRRARVKNGPWRCTRYRLLVFLLTSDGVRQLTTELDFKKAAFRGWERTNYRYDAVAAVQVSVHDDAASEFHLFLVNGTDIQVAVPESGRAGEGEDARVLADAADDATGIRHTLFVLEGVAAEGRRWWEGTAYRRASEVRA